MEHQKTGKAVSRYLSYITTAVREYMLGGSAWVALHLNITASIRTNQTCCPDYSTHGGTSFCGQEGGKRCSPWLAG